MLAQPLTSLTLLMQAALPANVPKLPADPVPAPAALRAPSNDLVLQQLRRGLRQRRISVAEARHYRWHYLAIRRSLGRVGPAARAELRGMLGDIKTLARDGRLQARLQPTGVILAANHRWLVQQRQKPAAFGTRRDWEGVVVQAYPGHGWQWQPLATATTLQGRINARAPEAELLQRALALQDMAVPRGGGVAWEYYFDWQGSGPGWASAMPTALAARALVTIGRAQQQPQLIQLARDSLQLLRYQPPRGVGVRRGQGRRAYLLYSQNPRLWVGNAQAATLIGLYEYVQLVPNDPQAAELLADGLEEMRRTVAAYDTGYWSRYSLGSSRPESDWEYHQLFGQLLRGLCRRVPDPAWCKTSDRFLAYESAPLRLQGVRMWRGRQHMLVRYWTSKPGRVRLSLWQGERLLRFWNLPAGLGQHQVVLPWPYRAARRAKWELVSLGGVSSEQQWLLRAGRGLVLGAD